MNKFNTEQTEQALNKVSRGMNVQQFSLTSVDWKVDKKDRYISELCNTGFNDRRKAPETRILRGVKYHSIGWPPLPFILALL